MITSLQDVLNPSNSDLLQGYTYRRFHGSFDTLLNIAREEDSFTLFIISPTLQLARQKSDWLVSRLIPNINTGSVSYDKLQIVCGNITYQFICMDQMDRMRGYSPDAEWIWIEDLERIVERRSKNC